MLARASTVVLRNRRRYSMRTRNGRPRRQSAPTVMQRAPLSPRGFPPSSPCRGSGSPSRYLSTSSNAFTYPHTAAVGRQTSSGSAALKANSLRRGSIQLHHLSGGSCSAHSGGGGGGLSPRTSIRSPSSPTPGSLSAGAVASANAALREVTLDSPKLRRITFQDWKKQKQEEEQEEQECGERQRRVSLSPSGHQSERVVSLPGSCGSRASGEYSSLRVPSPCDCDPPGTRSVQVVLDYGPHSSDNRCHILRVSGRLFVWGYLFFHCGCCCVTRVSLISSSITIPNNSQYLHILFFCCIIYVSL